MQQGGKVAWNFSLQGKKWKSLFISFPCRQLTPNFAGGDYCLVGKALSPQSGRQHTVTTVIWGPCRLLQLTAVKEWLAKSWAGAFKYFFMTFNPPIKSKCHPSLSCKTQPNIPLLSSKHGPITAFHGIWDYLKLADYLNRWNECRLPVRRLMLDHVRATMGMGLLRVTHWRYSGLWKSLKRILTYNILTWQGKNTEL